MIDRKLRFESLLADYLNGLASQEDRVFIEQCLQSDAWARQSLDLSGAIRDGVKAAGPVTMPDRQQIDRLMQRWAGQQSKGLTISEAPNRLPWWSRRAWIMPTGSMALAASLFLVMFGVLPQEVGVLHSDRLDGKPDLELVLAKGLDPEDAAVRERLSQSNAVVLSHRQIDGHHRLIIDLQRQAQTQDALIAGLRDAGHLQSYAVLASQ